MANAACRGEFTMLHVINKEEISQTNDFSLHFKKPRKEQQVKSKERI